MDEGQSLDLVRKQPLKTNLRQARSRVPDAVISAYSIVVTKNEKGQTHAFKLPAEGGALFPRIQKDKRSRTQDTAVKPAALLPGGPYDLWQERETTRRVAELADAFARYPRLPKLLKPRVVRDTVMRGVEEGLLVARLPRPDGSARTFWRQKVVPEALKDSGLEVVLPENAELASLDPEMLTPPSQSGGSTSGGLFAAGADGSGASALPGLWDGESVELAAIETYFGGGHTVTIARQGFDEDLSIPRCDAQIVRGAVVEAVKGGLLWLVNGPTSLWEEPVPEGALGTNAELRPRPEAIPAQKLLPQSLPGAWKNDAANGISLNQALAQNAGENLPWGLVRKSIRTAVDSRWLKVASGAVDCDFDQAGSLILKRPAAARPDPIPDPPDPPKPHAGTASSWAVLKPTQMDDLADALSDLQNLTAGHGLQFQIRLELTEAIQRHARDNLNRKLAQVSADLKID